MSPREVNADIRQSCTSAIGGSARKEKITYLRALVASFAHKVGDAGSIIVAYLCQGCHKNRDKSSTERDLQ